MPDAVVFSGSPSFTRIFCPVGLTVLNCTQDGMRWQARRAPKRQRASGRSCMEAAKRSASTWQLLSWHWHRAPVYTRLHLLACCSRRAQARCDRWTMRPLDATFIALAPASPCLTNGACGTAARPAHGGVGRTLDGNGMPDALACTALRDVLLARLRPANVAIVSPSTKQQGLQHTRTQADANAHGRTQPPAQREQHKLRRWLLACDIQLPAEKLKRRRLRRSNVPRCLRTVATFAGGKAA